MTLEQLDTWLAARDAEAMAQAEAAREAEAASAAPDRAGGVSRTAERLAAIVPARFRLRVLRALGMAAAALPARSKTPA